MRNYNCWEFKKCGREPGGINADKLGVCPAATEAKLNGINHGLNGGRSCWGVEGTECSGKMHTVYALRLAECSKCEFYQLVYEEEDWSYCNAKAIQKKLVFG